MENKLHILLCEDEESLGMLVREYLQAKGYDAELYLDGEAGYKAFVKGEYDMCLLDVMMPKMDGFTLARELRMINSEVPIMFLTAKNLKDDILEGFKLGADDYLTKPFSMDELVYRMEAILRRVKARNKQMAVRYQLGRFVFDTQRQLLTIGDKSTKLTTKALASPKIVIAPTEAARLFRACASIRIVARSISVPTSYTAFVPSDISLFHSCIRSASVCRNPFNSSHSISSSGM